MNGLVIALLAAPVLAVRYLARDRRPLPEPSDSPMEVVEGTAK